MHRLLVLVLSVTLGLSGCKTQAASRTEDADMPHCRGEAQFWEAKASREIAAAGKGDDVGMKRRHYDVALDDLRKSRALYEAELAEDTAGKMSPARRTAIESEIERLSRAVERTTRDRPAQAR